MIFLWWVNKLVKQNIIKKNCLLFFQCISLYVFFHNSPNFDCFLSSMICYLYYRFMEMCLEKNVVTKLFFSKRTPASSTVNEDILSDIVNETSGFQYLLAKNRLINIDRLLCKCLPTSVCKNLAMTFGRK
jgi:hypothetical protein